MHPLFWLLGLIFVAESKTKGGASSGQLAPHFKLADFASKDGAAVPADYLPNLRRLVAVLEVIRARWGGPLGVVSGFRSPAHNAQVKGVEASAHLTAEAADIVPLPRSPENVAKLHALISGMASGGELAALRGLGEYPGPGRDGRGRWVHVDVKGASPRRWVG